MKKFFNHFKKIPWYGWLIGVGLLIVQLSTYWISNAISLAIGNSARAIEPKIDGIDNAIPVIPFFVIFYCYSYIYWIESCASCSGYGKKKMMNVIFGALFAYLLSIVFYLAIPTFMDREKEGILAISEQPGFFNWLMHLIYQNDGWERAYNLFPSFHCLVSTYYFLATLDEKKAGRGYKIYSGITAFLICLSTIFIKQHYIIDLFVGILLGIGIYYLFRWLNFGGKIFKDKTVIDLEKED